MDIKEITMVIGALVGGSLISAGLLMGGAEPWAFFATGVLLGAGATYYLGGAVRSEEECRGYVPQVPLNMAHPSAVDATVIRSRWLEVYGHGQ